MVVLYIYIIVIMITKWKCDFKKKRDLQRSVHLRMIAVQFFGSSPWARIVARLKALVFCCSDLTLDSSWTEMWSPDLLNTDSMKDRNLCILDWIHAKVGYRNLCTLGGLSTIEIDENDKLVSWDVCGWWVARAISERATEITTWQGDLVLCWFDSQVCGSFLFYLIVW